jgi:ankyrin repeat protein
MRACYNGGLDVVKYLVEDKNVMLDIVNKNGENCLQAAVRGSQKDVVKYLCDNLEEFGINIEYECPRTGLSAYARACLE